MKMGADDAGDAARYALPNDLARCGARLLLRRRKDNEEGSDCKENADRHASTPPIPATLALGATAAAAAKPTQNSSPGTRRSRSGGRPLGRDAAAAVPASCFHAALLPARFITCGWCREAWAGSQASGTRSWLHPPIDACNCRRRHGPEPRGRPEHVIDQRTSQALTGARAQREIEIPSASLTAAPVRRCPRTTRSRDALSLDGMHPRERKRTEPPLSDTLRLVTRNGMEDELSAGRSMGAVPSIVLSDDRPEFQRPTDTAAVTATTPQVVANRAPEIVANRVPDRREPRPRNRSEPRPRNRSESGPATSSRKPSHASGGFLRSAPAPRES
jgi:hypothetical protein